MWEEKKVSILDFVDDIHVEMEHWESTHFRAFFFENWRGVTVSKKHKFQNEFKQDIITFNEVIEVPKGEWAPCAWKYYVFKKWVTTKMTKDMNDVVKLLNEVKSKPWVQPDELEKLESNTTSTDSTTEKETKPTTESSTDS